MDLPRPSAILFQKKIYLTMGWCGCVQQEACAKDMQIRLVASRMEKTCEGIRELCRLRHCVPLDMRLSLCLSAFQYEAVTMSEINMYFIKAG